MKYLYVFLVALSFAVIENCSKSEPLPKIQNKPKSQQSIIEKKKYITKYKFEDFPVKKIEKKNPAIKINTDISPYTKMFRTKIKQSFDSKDTNFAGKYILSYWGCGSPCHIGIAINVENGTLIEIPSASAGFDAPYKFKKDSRLLIINPPDSLGYYISGGAYDPEVYYLDTLKLKFIKLKN